MQLWSDQFLEQSEKFLQKKISINNDYSYNFFKNPDANKIDNSIKKRRRPSVNLLDWIQIVTRSKSGSSQLENLRCSYEDLIALEDELILLVLENCALDTALHKLKIILESPDNENVTFEDNDVLIKEGCFLSGPRIVKIYEFPEKTDYMCSLIHEFTHAMCFLTFRFPQLHCHPGLPFTIKATVYGNPFNPAELKFKQCVREDLAKSKNSVQEEYLFPQANYFSKLMTIPLSELPKFSKSCSQAVLLNYQLNHFFSSIETSYKKNIFDQNALSEVLPFYMQYRAEILRLAKEQGIPKEEALTILGNRLPRIHDFCETDIKRILKSRLKLFRNEFESQGLKSNILECEYSKNNQIDLVAKMDAKNILRGFWYEDYQELQQKLELF